MPPPEAGEARRNRKHRRARPRSCVSMALRRRINPESGAVLERLEMPRGTGVSGIESDGANLFYCGGGSSGTVRAVRRPKGERR